VTLRWEELAPGSDWHGYTGELLVAVVTKAPSGAKRWLWEVTVHRPPGWRNAGHGTSSLAAKRSADRYWMKWLEAAALRPDVVRPANAGQNLRSALQSDR
jgi:hypothetical protein